MLSRAWTSREDAESRTGSRQDRLHKENRPLRQTALMMGGVCPKDPAGPWWMPIPRCVIKVSASRLWATRPSLRHRRIRIAIKLWIQDSGLTLPATVQPPGHLVHPSTYTWVYTLMIHRGFHPNYLHKLWRCEQDPKCSPEPFIVNEARTIRFSVTNK